MSVCPGCGRCRQCGQPAPTPQPYPWWGWQPYGPIWITPPSTTVQPGTFTWTINSNTGTSI